MSPETILAGLPIWRAAPVLTPLMEGRTNRNFIIQDGDERYFGRVGIDLPHHEVWRGNERACAIAAAEGGVSPRVHYADGGILITAFIDGQTLRPADMHDEAAMTGTAQVLRRLHAIKAPDTLPIRCGVAISRRYLSETSDTELPLPREQIIARMGEPTLTGDRLVHSDIIPENLMRVPQGLLLIDWEYSGRGIPEVDLGSVIANADLTETDTRQLLDAYGPHRPELVEQQRVALIVREAMWCLAQMRHAGPEGDLVPYTKLCIERMLREFR